MLTAVLLALVASTDSAVRTVQYDFVVRAPVDRVWQAWSTPDGLATFFAPKAVIELKTFGKFEILHNPSAAPGLRGAEDNRILAVQPGRMLVTTWDAPPNLPEIRAQRTALIITLAPRGDSSTLVTIANTGFGRGGQWDEAYEYFRGAWSWVAAALQYRFEVGPIDWNGAGPNLSGRMIAIGGESARTWLQQMSKQRR
jgi:uncharacterized protein YndB with AHSA1/START domain